MEVFPASVVLIIRALVVSARCVCQAPVEPPVECGPLGDNPTSRSAQLDSSRGWFSYSQCTARGRCGRE